MILLNRDLLFFILFFLSTGQSKEPHISNSNSAASFTAVGLVHSATKYHVIDMLLCPCGLAYVGKTTQTENNIGTWALVVEMTVIIEWHYISMTLTSALWDSWQTFKIGILNFYILKTLAPQGLNDEFNLNIFFEHCLKVFVFFGGCFYKWSYVQYRGFRFSLNYIHLIKYTALRFFLLHLKKKKFHINYITLPLGCFWFETDKIICVFICITGIVRLLFLIVYSL